MGATTSSPVEDRNYSPELLEIYASFKDRPFLREILEAIPPSFAATTRLRVRNNTTLFIFVYHPRKTQPYATYKALRVLDISFAYDCKRAGTDIVNISRPVFSGDGNRSYDVAIFYRLYSGNNVPEMASVIKEQCK